MKGVREGEGKENLLMSPNFLHGERVLLLLLFFTSQHEALQRESGMYAGVKFLAEQRHEIRVRHKKQQQENEIISTRGRIATYIDKHYPRDRKWKESQPQMDVKENEGNDQKEEMKRGRSGYR